MALAVVLMVIVVFSVLGVGLLSVATTNTKLATLNRSDQSAYYVAEAGATYKLKEFSNQVNNAYSTTTSLTTASQFFSNIQLSTSSYNLPQEYGTTPSATVQVTDVTASGVTNPRQYQITSVGKVGNQTATVTQTMSVNFTPPAPQTFSFPNYAVFGSTASNSTITLDGSATIKGNIGTNATITPSVIMQPKSNPSIQGEVDVVPSVDLTKVLSIPSYITPPKTANLTSTYTFPDPVANFPAIPNAVQYPDQNVSLNGSAPYAVVSSGNVTIKDYRTANYVLDLTLDNSKIYSFNTVYVDSNYNLYINVGSQDRTIVINSLNIDTGNIILQGTGKLTVFVLNQFTMGSSSTFNSNGSVNRLNVYYPGTSAIAFSGGQQVNGSLYVKTADITIAAGSGFNGEIVTGGNNVTVKGGSAVNTQLFYAPNASFSMLNGSLLNGKIVCKSFSASGNALVNYVNMDTGSLPFTFPNPGGTANTPSTPPANLLVTKPMRQTK